MAVHWFAWLFFSLGIAVFLVGLLVIDHQPKSDNNFFGCVFCVAGLCLTFIGFIGSFQAHNQNTGLASRNTRYFKAQGYRVLNAYGHQVCVAAGPYPLCLQERKDATGRKQLVMKLVNGQWIVIHGPSGGFMDALAHAPQN